MPILTTKTKNLLHKALLVGLLMVGINLLTHTALATTDQFLTDYVIDYDVQPSGTTNVAHKVTITNLQSDVIATSYTLSLKQIDAYDISAKDSAGRLEVTQKKVDDTTNIEVTLRTFSIGEGQQNTVDISYKSNQIAKKIGDVWNINVPKAQSATSTTTQNINLNVPITFGPKIFISPTPTLEKADESTYRFNYSNEHLANKAVTSITASFGEFQTLNYRLRYQLTNPNKFSTYYDIALPLDMQNTQQVAYDSIDPKPTKIKLDNDGNMMATYKLKSQESLEITVTGSVKLLSRQIDPKSGGSFDNIPRQLISRYTKKDIHWDTQDENVVDLANNFSSDNTPVAESAQKIYDFLVNNYEYDFSIINRDTVERQGASQALIQKEAWGCMEFTDSFITIARSMGIPAREINGYAISDTEQNRPLSLALKNGDLLHAWPEFYDPKFGWVQIDPTWGNTAKIDYFTKLDTNHFAFVVKGINSEYPYPAGTYRSDNSEKLVEIAFAQNDGNTIFEPNIKTAKRLNLNVFELLKGNRKVLIENHSKIVMYYGDSQILPNEKKTVYVHKSLDNILLINSLGEKFYFPVGG